MTEELKLYILAMTLFILANVYLLNGKPVFAAGWLALAAYSWIMSRWAEELRKNRA